MGVEVVEATATKSESAALLPKSTAAGAEVAGHGDESHKTASGVGRGDKAVAVTKEKVTDESKSDTEDRRVDPTSKPSTAKVNLNNKQL